MTAPRGIARNFAILSASQALSRLLSFLVTIHLGRQLGADGFGALGFAVAALAYGKLIVEFGFDALGPIEVARGRIPLRDLVSNIVTLRLLLSILAIALVVGFSRLAPVPDAARPLLVIYALSLVTDAIDLQWVFLGAETMTPVGVAEIVQQGLLAAGVFAFVWSPGDLMVVPRWFIAGRALAVAFLLIEFVRRHGFFTLGLDRQVISPLVSASLPLSGSMWAGALLHNFDLVLLGLITGAEAAGLYNAAYRILWAPTLVALAYLTALRPPLARAVTSGPEVLLPLLRRSGKLALTFGVGAAIGGVILAEPILLWLFGPSYSEAAGAMRLLMASFAIFPISRLCRSIAVAGGKNRADLSVIAAAAAINVGLNLVLVPTTGVMGAAFATFVSEAFLFGLAARIAWSVAGRLPFAESLAGTLGAGLLLAVSLWLSHPLHAALRVGLGTIVYVTALFALRVLTRQDLGDGTPMFAARS